MAQTNGNSPGSPGFCHRARLPVANLRFDMIQQLRASSAGREIPLDFAIPLEAVSFSQPSQKGGLLFDRECLDLVLNIHDIHVRMVPHPSNLYRVDASPYILRQNSRFTVTTKAAITTVAPKSTAKLPASVARLITAPSPTVEYVFP